ncbi:MAG: cation diffusion facilitator family transporter [Pseudomonadota bacterium]
MKKARKEDHYLRVTAIGSAVLGCLGIGFTFATGSQAILLDGLFNLAYCVAALFTIKVARLIQRGEDEEFPFGYLAFEPLVNGLKGLMMLGVILFALVDAVATILAGGHRIEAGLALIYGVGATLACCTLALVARRAAKKTGSPLLQADAENWMVNGAVSSAVLLGFIGIFVIEGTGAAFLTPYVDSILVILVSLVSIAVPVRMAWRSLMELLARAPDADIVAGVRRSVEISTAELPVQDLFLRVLQYGRTQLVLVHVVLPEDYEVGSLQDLDAIQAKTQEALSSLNKGSVLDMVFTANPALGAPLTGTAKPR